jgi:predicted dehydrogenase
MGILGAARIAPVALVKPAHDVPEVTVTAVAARDAERAGTFAAKHGIPTTHTSYDALIDDPDIDAVYIPLPNGLHAEWTLRAIDAGKHVLCEKPFTANADEARTVAAAAAKSGLTVMEAFHYRYHPLAERMRAITHDGTIGTVREIRTTLAFPLPKFSDIRYNYALGGGAMMDACYAVHCMRLLGTGDPVVVDAKAKMRGDQVDRAMTAHYRFPDGAVGRTDASMWSKTLLKISAHAIGDRGEMRVFNFVAPHMYNRLTVKADGKTTRERVRGDATYLYQLRAFVGAVLRGEPTLTPPDDAITTMQLIDDVYRAAGLPIRGAG